MVKNNGENNKENEDYCREGANIDDKPYTSPRSLKGNTSVHEELEKKKSENSTIKNMHNYSTSQDEKYNEPVDPDEKKNHNDVEFMSNDVTHDNEIQSTERGERNNVKEVKEVKEEYEDKLYNGNHKERSPTYRNNSNIHDSDKMYSFSKKYIKNSILDERHKRNESEDKYKNDSNIIDQRSQSNNTVREYKNCLPVSNSGEDGNYGKSEKYGITKNKQNQVHEESVSTNADHSRCIRNREFEVKHYAQQTIYGDKYVSYRNSYYRGMYEQNRPDRFRSKYEYAYEKGYEGQPVENYYNKYYSGYSNFHCKVYDEKYYDSYSDKRHYNNYYGLYYGREEDHYKYRYGGNFKYMKEFNHRYRIYPPSKYEREGNEEYNHYDKNGTYIDNKNKSYIQSENKTYSRYTYAYKNRYQTRDETYRRSTPSHGKEHEEYPLYDERAKRKNFDAIEKDKVERESYNDKSTSSNDKSKSRSRSRSRSKSRSGSRGKSKSRSGSKGRSGSRGKSKSKSKSGSRGRSKSKSGSSGRSGSRGRSKSRSGSKGRSGSSGRSKSKSGSRGRSRSSIRRKLSIRNSSSRCRSDNSQRNRKVIDTKEYDREKNKNIEEKKIQAAGDSSTDTYYSTLYLEEKKGKKKNVIYSGRHEERYSPSRTKRKNDYITDKHKRIKTEERKSLEGSVNKMSSSEKSDKLNSDYMHKYHCRHNCEDSSQKPYYRYNKNTSINDSEQVLYKESFYSKNKYYFKNMENSNNHSHHSDVHSRYEQKENHFDKQDKYYERYYDKDRHHNYYEKEKMRYYQRSNDKYYDTTYGRCRRKSESCETKDTRDQCYKKETSTLFTKEEQMKKTSLEEKGYSEKCKEKRDWRKYNKEDKYTERSTEEKRKEREKEKEKEKEKEMQRRNKRNKTEETIGDIKRFKRMSKERNRSRMKETDKEREMDEYMKRSNKWEPDKESEKSTEKKKITKEEDIKGGSRDTERSKRKDSGKDSKRSKKKGYKETEMSEVEKEKKNEQGKIQYKEKIDTQDDNTYECYKSDVDDDEIKSSNNNNNNNNNNIGKKKEKRDEKNLLKHSESEKLSKVNGKENVQEKKKTVIKKDSADQWRNIYADYKKEITTSIEYSDIFPLMQRNAFSEERFQSYYDKHVSHYHYRKYYSYTNREEFLNSTNNEQVNKSEQYYSNTLEFNEEADVTFFLTHRNDYTDLLFTSIDNEYLKWKNSDDYEMLYSKKEKPNKQKKNEYIQEQKDDIRKHMHVENTLKKKTVENEGIRTDIGSHIKPYFSKESSSIQIDATNWINSNSISVHYGMNKDITCSNNSIHTENNEETKEKEEYKKNEIIQYARDRKTVCYRDENKLKGTIFDINYKNNKYKEWDWKLLKHIQNVKGQNCYIFDEITKKDSNKKSTKSFSDSEIMQIKKIYMSKHTYRNSNHLYDSVLLPPTYESDRKSTLFKTLYEIEESENDDKTQIIKRVYDKYNKGQTGDPYQDKENEKCEIKKESEEASNSTSIICYSNDTWSSKVDIHEKNKKQLSQCDEIRSSNNNDFVDKFLKKNANIQVEETSSFARLKKRLINIYKKKNNTERITDCKLEERGEVSDEYGNIKKEKLENSNYQPIYKKKPTTPEWENVNIPKEYINLNTTADSFWKTLSIVPYYVNNIIEEMHSEYENNELNKNIHMLNLHSNKTFYIPPKFNTLNEIMSTTNFLKRLEKKRREKTNWKGTARQILKKEFAFLSHAMECELSDIKIKYLMEEFKEI